jgi:hypothetical protein
MISGKTMGRIIGSLSLFGGIGLGLSLVLGSTTGAAAALALILLMYAFNEYISSQQRITAQLRAGRLKSFAGPKSRAVLNAINQDDWSPQLMRWPRQRRT